jgi:hypothetical protein
MSLRRETQASLECCANAFAIDCYMCGRHDSAQKTHEADSHPNQPRNGLADFAYAYAAFRPCGSLRAFGRTRVYTNSVHLFQVLRELIQLYAPSLHLLCLAFPSNLWYSGSSIFFRCTPLSVRRNPIREFVEWNEKQNEGER